MGPAQIGVGGVDVDAQQSGHVLGRVARRVQENRFQASALPRSQRLPQQAMKRLERGGERFDLIFADPPYAARVVPQIVGTLGAAGLLNPGAIACIEHDKREIVPSTSGRLAKVDERRFGDSVVSIYRVP